MNILLHLMLLHGCILRPNQNHFGILHILHWILIFSFWWNCSLFFFNVLSNSFYCRTAASTTHCKHTFDALFTQDLFRTQANCFTRTLAVGDSVSGTVFKTRETRKGKRGREREQDREKRRRAIWIGVWSIFKRFFRVLTWSDQKHPTGTGPCSHKGRPLMPLPWLPCWPTTPAPLSTPNSYPFNAD